MSSGLKKDYIHTNNKIFCQSFYSELAAKVWLFLITHKYSSKKMKIAE